MSGVHREMNDAPPPSRKVLGEGTFGIVVGPALSNWNNDLKEVTYPRNVTKIFKTKRNRNKAIANSKRLKRTVKNLEATAELYRRPYRIRNLNASIRERVRAYLGPGTLDNRVLSLLRVPYLGQSIYHIDRTETAQRAVRNIPYQVLCAQMLKCMQVVQAIHAAGYIHGDIRETNVLCHLETGALTIIDFDWLKPFDVFYRQYPVFYYSHPPEALFIWGRDGITIENMMGNYWADEELYRSVWKEGYDIYNIEGAARGSNYFSRTFVPNPIPHPGEDIPWELFRRGLFDVAKNYIDSYGLAHSFSVLLEKAWYISHNPDGTLREPPRRDISLGGVEQEQNAAKKEKEYQRFLLVRLYIVQILLPRMLASDYTERWDIATAIEKFTKALRHFGVKIEEWLPKDKKQEEVEAELAFMRDFADFHLVEPGAIPSPVPPKGPPSVTDKQEALEQVQAAVGAENIAAGGQRRVRKTVKNGRSNR